MGLTMTGQSVLVGTTKVLCLRGHQFDRTIVGSDGRHHRVCRICQRDYGRAYYLARKAEAA